MAMQLVSYSACMHTRHGGFALLAVPFIDLALRASYVNKLDIDLILANFIGQLELVIVQV